LLISTSSSPMLAAAALIVLASVTSTSSQRPPTCWQSWCRDLHRERRPTPSIPARRAGQRCANPIGGAGDQSDRSAHACTMPTQRDARLLSVDALDGLDQLSAPVSLRAGEALEASGLVPQCGAREGFPKAPRTTDFRTN
jgi:hypothetical protein